MGLSAGAEALSVHVVHVDRAQLGRHSSTRSAAASACVRRQRARRDDLRDRLTVAKKDHRANAWKVLTPAGRDRLWRGKKVARSAWLAKIPAWHRHRRGERPRASGAAPARRG